MEDIAKKKKIPSRVRFMLQDVIDLRRNSWRPRREKAGPKTLDQIHKEAEREKTQAKLMEMAGPNVNSGGGGGGGGGNQNNRGDRDNRGKRSSRGPQQSMEADEWNTVAYSGRSKGFDRSDAQKIQNLAMNANKTQDSSNMSLGPGYRSWGKGSGSAPKPPQQNRFSAIQNSDAEGQSRRNFSASMGNFNRSSNSRGSSVDPDRAGALEAVKQFSAVTSNGPNLGKNSLDHVATSSVATSPVATSQVATSPVMSSSVATSPIATSTVATSPVATSRVGTNQLRIVQL